MHDAVVIGAGMAGLRVCEMLTESGVKCVLVESSKRAGGRVATIVEHGEVAYESGPWRIPQNHRRARALFKKHKVQLSPLRTPTPAYYTNGTKVPGLSSWDVAVLKSANPITADRLDLSTGYADETHADSSTAPYQTESKAYYVAPQGFSELVRRMSLGVCLMADARVVDLKRVRDHYSVHMQVRDGANAFRPVTLLARAVFVCVPPGVTGGWPSYASQTRCHRLRVESESLHHIYAHSSDDRKPFHKLCASSPLAQSISSQYDNAWWQISYTAGRLARFWHRLRMLDYSTFARKLYVYAARLLGPMRHPDEYRSHFWPVAFHVWRPVPKFDMKSAVLTSVHPNRSALPRVYCAGEAFSSYQAWIEGALETAELAVKAYRTQSCHLPLRDATQREMVIEGRILSHLSEWETGHPGGALPIQRHVGEDVTLLFQHIGHSDNAWAVAAARQVAWSQRV